MSSSDSFQYSDYELLQLSGIQHYMFCPRQWALMQLEQTWHDNHLTAEGSWLHENVDNPFLRETASSNVITLRGIRLASYSLGLSGIADAVEIIPYENAPFDKKELLNSRLFYARPVEYKRGSPKTSDCDRIQVACQAMILEEILGVPIQQGAIFYWQTRHREYFDISTKLRETVVNISQQMHKTLSAQNLPPAIKKKGCRSCSLFDFCIPSLTGKSAKKYIINSLESLTENHEKTT